MHAATASYGPNHGFIWDATNGMTHLENPDRWWWGGHAVDLNGNGRVVGRACWGSTFYGCAWDGSPTPTQIGTTSFAYGVNEAGLVVGSLGANAFMWDGSTVTDLGQASGETTRGYAVNASGHVAGVIVDDHKNALITGHRRSIAGMVEVDVRRE